MTEKEFDGMNAITALYAGCLMLRNLYEDVRNDIPDELKDSFIELKQVLDDLRNPIYHYLAYNRSMCIESEEEIENEN